MKKPKTTVIVGIVIVGGFVLLGFGINEICGSESQELIKKIDNYSFTQEFPIGKPVTIDLIPVFEQRKEAPFKHLYLTLENDVVFGGDVIEIKLEGQEVRDDVARAFLIVTDDDWTTSGKKLEEIVYERDRAEKIKRLVEITSYTDPKFISVEPMQFLRPNTDIHVTGAILFVNKTFSVINLDDVLFTTASRTDRIEAETNVAIQKQIEQTEFGNLQQERTNQLFLGLSIIGVALVPIIGGFDFLFRIHID